MLTHFYILHFQFSFKSYSAEDDDYEGYDYSLTGRLSAVRIVFLYRFIREVSANGNLLPWSLAILELPCISTIIIKFLLLTFPTTTADDSVLHGTCNPP